MERMKFFLRKDTITSENKTEFLEKSFNHIKQQKLSVNSSVERTKLVVDTMVSERNQRGNTSSSNDMNTNGTFQQDMENNFGLDETFHVTENCELSNTNEAIDQRELNNSRYSNTTDACMQSNINLNISANNYDNSQHSIQDNKKALHGKRNMASSCVYEFYGSPSVPFENCEKDETLVKVCDLSEVRTKFTANNNISENENIQKTNSKVKNESRNNNEIKNMNFKCNPVKQENTLKSKINILSNSKLSKIPHMIKTNDFDDDNNKMENNAKFYRNEKMLAKEKFFKNNIKANYPCFTLKVNKIKINDFKKVTANKSVTDLINYFEDLNNSKGTNVKHLNVKSQRNLFERKEKMKLENVNRCVEPNAFSKTTGTEILKIGCSTGYKESPYNTTPEAIVAGGDTNIYQNMLSSAAAVGFCTNYKGNCDPMGQITHRLEDKVIQRHILIFSDDSKNKELPETLTSRCIRTRYTRKMNRPRDDEKVHLSLTSNKAKENEIFFRNNLNQTAVEIRPNDSGNKLCLNQDFRKRQKLQENILPQIEYTNSTKRVSAGKLFIGVFLSATICVAFWKAFAEYQKLQENILPRIKYTNSTKRVSAGKLFIGIFLSATIWVAFRKAVAVYRKLQENILPKIKSTNSTKRVSAGKLFIGIFLSATICVAFWKVVTEYSADF